MGATAPSGQPGNISQFSVELNISQFSVELLQQS
jgi:hypothetical protein